MWFYKVTRLEAITNKEGERKQPSKSVITPDYKRTAWSVGLVIALVILAIIANVAGWSHGADQILSMASTLGIGLFIGAYAGETGAVRTK